MDPSRLRDAKRWTLTLLPMPKRHPRGRGFGLCGGFVVGYVEGGRGAPKPYWWPGGKPEPLVVEGRKYIRVGGGRGTGIAGTWSMSDDPNGGAIGWRLNGSGALEAIDLHPKQGYAWTAAAASGAGAFAGYGQPAVPKGERPVERALFWGPDDAMVELPTPDGAEAIAQATDGEWVGGRVGRVGPNQRAAIWKVRGLELIVLSDDIGEVYGVADGEQVGVIPGTDFVSRAALWRGSPGSLVDLTPAGHATASALACHGGLQVGMATKEALAPDGGGSKDTRAILWAGSAASHMDLHEVVPPSWTASSAAMIEVTGSDVRVSGTVSRYESGILVAQVPALWQADAG